MMQKNEKCTLDFFKTAMCYKGTDFDENSGCYESDEMKSFFKAFKKDLKKMLSSEFQDFISLKAKPNHFDFSGVIKIGEKFIYISLGDLRMNKDFTKDILIRNMRHEKDFSGGRNNFVELKFLSESIKNLLEREEF